MAKNVCPQMDMRVLFDYFALNFAYYLYFSMKITLLDVPYLQVGWKMQLKMLEFTPIKIQLISSEYKVNIGGQTIYMRPRKSNNTKKIAYLSSSLSNLGPENF